MKTEGMDPSFLSIPSSSVGTFSLCVMAREREGKGSSSSQPSMPALTSLPFRAQPRQELSLSMAQGAQPPIPAQLSPHGRVCCCQAAALAQPKPPNHRHSPACSPRPCWHSGTLHLAVFLGQLSKLQCSNTGTRGRIKPCNSWQEEGQLQQ